MIVAGLPLGNIISKLLSEGVSIISTIMADWLLNLQVDRFLELTGPCVVPIELNVEFVVCVWGLRRVCHKLGHCLYFGSTHGTSGIRVRIKYHVKANKKTHWHIDQITPAGRAIEFLVVPDGYECSLRKKAVSLSKLTVSVTSFGSSDCRPSPAHFLAVSVNSRLLLTKLAEMAGKKIYSVPSLLSMTAAQPSTV